MRSLPLHGHADQRGELPRGHQQPLKCRRGAFACIGVVELCISSYWLWLISEFAKEKSSKNAILTAFFYLICSVTKYEVRTTNPTLILCLFCARRVSSLTRSPTCSRATRRRRSSRRCAASTGRATRRDKLTEHRTPSSICSSVRDEFHTSYCCCCCCYCCLSFRRCFKA